MFLKRDDPHLLIVGMTGVKMGDRFVQIGCAHGGRLAAVAGKVGLSGRAVLVAPDEASAERGRKGAENAGVLVGVEIAPPTRLPLEADDFDLAVVDDTAGLLGTMHAEDRVAAIRELRAYSPAGGRVLRHRRRRRAAASALCSRGRRADRRLSHRATRSRRSKPTASRRCAHSPSAKGSSFVEGMKPRAG